MRRLGGTLLGLALTRPRFGWVERLEDSSRSSVEALITVVAFAMGGYAYGSLYIVLHRHLEADIIKAALLLLVATVVYIVVRRKSKPTSDLPNTESESPEAVPAARETP
jgi:NhaP-type Na+/H+ or K+/H+ antiporter